MLLRTFKRSMLQPLTPDPLYLRLALSCMSQGATMSLKWWRVDHESKGLRVQAPSVQHCPQPSWLINQQFAWDSLLTMPKSNQLHTCCCCREGLLTIFDMVTNNERPASKWIEIKITNTNKERRDAPTKVQKGERKSRPPHSNGAQIFFSMTPLQRQIKGEPTVGRSNLPLSALS